LELFGSLKKSRVQEIEQGMGSGDGTVVRVLASQQCGPGSILSRCHMWVEFVVGSRLAPRFFSPGSPVFLPPQKPTSPNKFHFNQNKGPP